MNDTVNRLLERQAERRRKRRVRALQNAACAVLAAVCILCLAQLDAEDRAAAMEGESAPVQPIAYVAEPVSVAVQELPDEPQPPGYIRDDIPLPADLQITLHDAAEEFGVDYYIMLALIEQESDYRNITGDGGDSIGYCQIQPRWWAGLMDEIGATDLIDPEDNFRTACAILAELMERHGSAEYALTAYNRGTQGESEYARAVMAGAEEIAHGHDQ